MLTSLFKTPFPWFGGKSDAAPLVWAALGDCEHYVEPFAGSLAVLLRRPHQCNRTYHSETVNDLDGLLCNAWRSIQHSPDATADSASWPVCEADMHARHLALVRWREERQLEHIMGDPAWHDPVMAGWWIWGQSCWIGSGWCSGHGAWTADADGRLVKAQRGKGEVSFKQLPHLGTNGQGCNRPQAGVAKQLPHLGNDGQGCNHAGTREPGVSKQLPQLGNDGKGVNRPQAREPGVAKQLPFLGNNGQGCNRPQAREPGVTRKLPHLGDDGKGCNHAGAREPGTGDPEYHPMTMPELRRWFAFLSARLRHVRILNGDWRRVLTGGASKILSVRMGGGHCGIFLDPPYTTERTADLYACEGGSESVQAWCLANGPDPMLRIVVAGFDTEHEVLESHGWRVVEWYRAGFLLAELGRDAVPER